MAARVQVGPVLAARVGTSLARPSSSGIYFRKLSFSSRALTWTGPELGTSDCDSSTIGNARTAEGCP